MLKHYQPLAYAPLDDDYLVWEDMDREEEPEEEEWFDEEEDEEDGPDPLRLAKEMSRTAATVQLV